MTMTKPTIDLQIFIGNTYKQKWFIRIVILHNSRMCDFNLRIVALAFNQLFEGCLGNQSHTKQCNSIESKQNFEKFICGKVCVCF